MKLHIALLTSLSLLATVGCGEDSDGKGGDGDQDTGSDTGSDTVDADGDGSFSDEDCDDDDATINPSADEICDGVDNDCDSLIDAEDDSVTGLLTFYADGDGDTYGDELSPIEACEESDGVVADNTDCDDTSDAVNPAAEEVCDEIDNDCDGAINGETATDASEWYPDVDLDAYGDELATPTRECEAPDGMIADNTDCDDNKFDVKPGAIEVWYDGVDGNCDGLSDYDADGDGEDIIDEAAGTGTDCDDDDATVNTAATTDTWYDGIDTNCDGLSDYDADLDGYDSDEYDGLDCDDTDGAVSPDAVDVWYDGADDDCSGGSDYDADGDGWDSDLWSGDDCDDDDATAYPYALELSTDTDGVDNDCDGATDSADTDAVALDLGDDSYEQATFSSMVFPFCGSDYSEIFVDSNGRIFFDESTGYDYGESAGDMATDMSIAVFWDDMNPSDSDSVGGVYVVEHADAVGVYWWDIVPYGGSATDVQRFAVLMYDDGSFAINHDTVTESDGATGFSCGPGSYTAEEDLSAAEAHSGALGIGDGTEELFFEVWYSVVSGGTSTYDSADAFDLGGWTSFCGVGGEDADEDGYTTECGDPDDGDAAITP